MTVGRLGRAMADEIAKARPKTPQRAAVAPQRVHKYGAQKTVCRKQHKHPSKKEAARCDELHLLWKGGAIDKLEMQPVFPIEVMGQKICKYIADFRYLDGSTGKSVVEDVKGRRTSVYMLKRKLMRACYGIEVLET